MEYSKNFGFALPSSANDVDLADINEIANNFRKIDENAVKKEAGKGLSENDFTDAEKQKLQNALLTENIDQKYNPTSENPQSGLAVAQATKILKDHIIKLGKNLYDETKFLSDTRADGTTRAGETCSYWIKVVENESYVLSRKSIVQAYFRIYGKDSAGTLTSIYEGNIKKEGYVFTIPSGITHIRFSCINANFVDIQLEQGTVKTEYEAYEEFLNLDLLRYDTEITDESVKAPRTNVIKSYVDNVAQDISDTFTAEAQPKQENNTIPALYSYLGMVDALREQVSQLNGYISKLHTPTILDNGVCGEHLTWALYSDGLLKISGYGRSYDYCKGILQGMTRAEIEKYVIDNPHKVEQGFQEGKVYDDANGQYVSPWYKYRDERSFIEEQGEDGYCYKSTYDAHNPNGWKYNRIEIDEGITYLGDWLFYRVCGPVELIIPNGVTEIGRWSIRLSPTLKYIHLPDGVETIAYNGCSNCQVATTIRLGSGFKNVATNAFASNLMVRYLNIQGAEGENSVCGDYVCNANEKLEYLSFENITEIGAYFTNRCTSLKKIDLPDTLVTILKNAFSSARDLTSIRIPPLVTTIESNAFTNCEKMKSVYIDSPTVASGITEQSSFGYVIYYAKYVYIKKDITDIGSYITSKYAKKNEVDGYILYVKND